MVGGQLTLSLLLVLISLHGVVVKGEERKRGWSLVAVGGIEWEWIEEAEEGD